MLNVAVLMLVCLYCLLLLKVTNKGVNCAFLKGCIDVVLHKNTSIAPNEVTKYFYHTKWHAIQTLVSLSNENLSAGNPLDFRGETGDMCVTPKKCVWNSLKNAWISSWGEKIMCSMGISAFLTLEYYENMKYYKNIICSVGISAFSSLQHMIGAIQLSFFFWKASPHVSPDAQLRKKGISTFLLLLMLNWFEQLIVILLLNK